MAHARAFAVLVAGAAAAAANVISSPVDFVNTLGGTQSRYDLSHGNILPLVNRPWGFNAWAPVTAVDSSETEGGGWWFHSTDARIFGLRCTHQPSPWIGDWGQFRVMADMPGAPPSHQDNQQGSGYKPSASSWSPHYFNASLLSAGNENGDFLTLEMTATVHGAAVRATFPPFVAGETNAGFVQTRRVYVSLNALTADSIDALADGSKNGGFPAVNGTVKANSGGVTPNFAHRFSLSLGGGPDGDQPLAVSRSGTGTGGDGAPWAWFEFDPSASPAADLASRVVTLRVATSLISADQAYFALQSELPPAVGFDALVAASKAAWNDVLTVVDVVDAGPAYTSDPTGQALRDVLTTLYSCLWRAAFFPQFLDEVDPSTGGYYHYSPYDPSGATYPGRLASSSGFWDAYRTVYSMGSILWPSVTAQQIQGWVAATEEGGWLPKWASPGYRGSMVGTMGDVSLADAIVKRDWLPGFNVTAAYAAIRKDAFETPPPGIGEGRTCLPQYLAGGAAIPANTGCGEAVSRTLNYILADWAIAQAALSLGGQAAAQDAPVLLARAANWSAQFDLKTGFFRNLAGPASSPAPQAFVEPFDQFAWGDPYTEAGPWQYRVYAPAFPHELHALYSNVSVPSPAGPSPLDMCDVIEAAQTMPSTFHLGAYGGEIHEQTEMASLVWGQYEHNNQPVHHVIPMLIAADPDLTVAGGCASRGQYWMRQALTRLYKPGADMFCGDEDNGQFSAWYMLGAMGLYALAPGNNDLTLGSPLFSHLRVRLDNASGLVQTPFLDIVAQGQSADAFYVTSVSLNGNYVVNSTSVPYTSVMAGGTLAFDMNAFPPSGRTGTNGHVKAAEEGRPWPWAVAHPEAKRATERAQRDAAERVAEAEAGAAAAAAAAERRRRD